MNHFVVAFSTYEWQLYVGMCFGVLSFCVTTLCRSVISKLVEPEEVGKVFAVVGAIQVNSLLFLLFWIVCLHLPNSSAASPWNLVKNKQTIQNNKINNDFNTTTDNNTFAFLDV